MKTKTGCTETARFRVFFKVVELGDMLWGMSKKFFGGSEQFALEDRKIHYINFAVSVKIC